MALLWASLVLAMLLATSGAVIVFRNGLTLWRDLRRVGKSLAQGIDELSRRAAQTAARIDEASSATADLDPSLARLRVSLARLAVLRAAVRDVQDAVGRVTAVYPSK